VKLPATGATPHKLQRAVKKMRRILIVEDEPMIAELVSAVLTDAGYEVIGIAEDERSAVKHANRNNPELVVMDIKLANNSDGVEVARRLQTQKTVSILFTSAYVDQRTFERASGLQRVGFLGKPYSPQCLLNAVANAEQERMITEQPRRTGNRRRGGGN
jgi:DNA-binding response OmpR family regulator